MIPSQPTTGPDIYFLARTQRKLHVQLVFPLKSPSIFTPCSFIIQDIHHTHHPPIFKGILLTEWGTDIKSYKEVPRGVCNIDEIRFYWFKNIMKIDLRLFASLARYLPDKSDGRSLIVEVDEETTVKDLLKRMGIPLGEVKLIFLNGIRSEMESPLKDGDRLGVFPPVAGG
jgi:molybdopterin converting factor small subunit